jgi:hypothetical protein
MISLIEFQRACEAQAAISIVPTALREVCAANARIVGEWLEELRAVLELLDSGAPAAQSRATERLRRLNGDETTEAA